MPDEIRCPYCKVEIRPLDTHISSVKGTRNYFDMEGIKPQIEVTCILVRSYIVDIEETK